MPGSNFSRNTKTEGFYGFCSLPPGKYRNNILKSATADFFHSQSNSSFTVIQSLAEIVAPNPPFPVKFPGWAKYQLPL
jgi:hypothetical protein